MRKNEKQRNKKNSGITLIALVITIIVLLILAGVTIATLTGENGILTKATEASKKTGQASAEEQVQLEVTASIGTDGKINTGESAGHKAAASAFKELCYSQHYCYACQFTV